MYMYVGMYHTRNGAHSGGPGQGLLRLLQGAGVGHVLLLQGLPLVGRDLQLPTHVGNVCIHLRKGTRGRERR